MNDRGASAEMLFKICSLSNRPHRNEPQSKYLARQTHLKLNGKGLTKAAMPAGACPNLKCIYLFDNHITRLEGLGQLKLLTNLYCQNNRISTISSDIGALTRLQKLYLNNNALASLAPLEPCVQLVELHASGQQLLEDETLDVAPQALAGMQSLAVLALADNHLSSLADLAVCRQLRTVDLSKNRLSSLSAVAPLLNASPLVECDLRQNPISDSRQNLDAVIVACPTVRTLNGRELTAAERPYLQQLHRRGRRVVDLASE